MYQRLFLLLSVLGHVLPSTAGAAVDAPAPVPRFESVARCSWDRPGHNPFMGEVVPAIDRYVDIPTLVRMRLKERMQRRDYDELVEIRRDAIVGKHAYRPEIRDMHFGLDRVCRQVSRSGWSEAMRERALVYCESGHCILVPTVCRNVSRVDRVLPLVAAESLDREPPIEIIEFAPPGAGRRLTDTSSFAESVAGETLAPHLAVVGVPLMALAPDWPLAFGATDVRPHSSGGLPKGFPGARTTGGVSPYVAVAMPGGGSVVVPIPESANWASPTGELGGGRGPIAVPGGGAVMPGPGPAGRNSPPEELVGGSGPVVAPDSGGPVVPIPEWPTLNSPPGTLEGGGGAPVVPPDGSPIIEPLYDPHPWIGPSGGLRGGDTSIVGSDGSSVNTVAEPATWTSLLGGLAALALVARRRRQGCTGAPRCATQKRS